MKKLYRKSTVHPKPSDHLLSFLPAAIFSLTAALSSQDKEVLAYLINQRKGTATTVHPPCFNCGCFRCYMSYWMKWDGSPNRQVIHEIIDAFEDSLLKESNNKRARRKGKNGKGNNNTISRLDEAIKEDCESTSAVEEELEKGSVRKFVSFVGERIWSVWG